MSKSDPFHDNKYFLAFFTVLAILITLTCYITVTSARSLASLPEAECADDITSVEQSDKHPAFDSDDSDYTDLPDNTNPTEPPANTPAAAPSAAIVFPLDGNITSLFSYRINPFYDPASGEEPTYEFHRGIDISASKSRDILASADGTVTYTGYDPGYGYHIIIEHEAFESLYAHCDTLFVSAGDIVRAGDSIAVAGSTGRSTGPHLHFEIRVDGLPADPLDFVGCVFTGKIY